MAWSIGVILVVAALIGVWQNNQPVDVEVRLNEASVQNDNLPSLKDAIVTMTLENETKKDTIHSLNTHILFTNIPHRYINKEVHMSVACLYYNDVDTTLILTKDVVLNIYRNPAVYGDVRFRLWNPAAEGPVANVEVTIAEQNTTSDENGCVSLFIPLEYQRQSYLVTASIPLENDTILLPCGEGYVMRTK